MSPVISLPRRALHDERSATSVRDTVEALAQQLQATAVARDRAGGHAAHERGLIRQSGLLTLTVRTADVGKPWVAKLVKAFQSPEVKAFVQANFSGSMVPAF